MNNNQEQSPAPHPRERIKVCHIAVGSIIAGAQRVMLDVCEHVGPGTYEYHVMCHEEGPLTEALRENGIQFHLLPSLDRSIRPHRDWRGILEIRRICREHRFDIVHTHSSKGGLLGRIGARIGGVPHILHHVHGYPFHEYSGTLARFAFVQLEKLAAKFCDCVVFVNDEERTDSIENRWIPEWKCITIYNGTDLDHFHPVNNRELRRAFRSEHSLPDDEVAILISGRLEPQKQSLILPGIAAKLQELRPDAKWRFLVAGTGDLEEELRRKLAELGVEKRVDLIGWSPEPHKAVSGADLMMLPSLWEGLPLVLIEGQAGGLPIVASDVKGNREVVTGDTGFLCPPRDPSSYAEALVRLIDDTSLREQFGTAARHRAEIKFDARQTMTKIAELYARLRTGDGEKTGGAA